MNNTSHLVIEFDMSIDDVAYVTYSQLKEMGTDKAYRRNLLKTAGSIFALAIAILAMNHDRFESYILPTVLTGSAIWISTLALRAKSKLITQSRETAKYVLDGEESRLFRLSLDDSGVLAEMPTHDIRYRWSAFLRCTQTETHLLMHFKQAGLIGIPHRVFAERYDKQRLLSFIDEFSGGYDQSSSSFVTT